MNNNQSENKEPDFFTPNAPIKYVMAGGRGVMIGCGIITAERPNRIWNVMTIFIMVE